MMLKEKTAENPYEAADTYADLKSTLRNAKNAVNPIVSMIFYCLCGALMSGAFGGGAGIPVCAALTAVLSPIYGISIFLGSTAAYLAAGVTGSFVTDIIAMPIMVCVRFFAELTVKGKPSPKAAAVMGGILYMLSGIAAAFTFKITAALIAAVLFRAVICGTVAYFAAGCENEFSSSGRINVTGEKGIGTAVLYVLAIAALSCVKYGSFCAGRAVGIFIILAAGGKFGSTGSAVVGVLTALGIILGESRGADLSDMVRSSAIVACSGLISGCFSKKSRTASSTAFTMSVFALMIFMGRLQWIAALMTDTIISAALYCLIPDKLYMKAIGGVMKSHSAVMKHCGDCTAFAAEALENMRKSVSKAADILGVTDRELKRNDIAEMACTEICEKCRNNSFCCKGSSRRQKLVFPSIIRILNAKGYITERELPKILESCTKKAELAELLNNEYRREGMEKRLTDAAEQLWNNACEQICAEEDLLRELGEKYYEDRIYDDSLSERVVYLIEKHGGEKTSAAVFFDSCGHIYISCFYHGQLDISMDKLTDKLTKMTDRDLEAPEILGENGIVRVRWHELPSFAVDMGKAVMNGREDVSGDCSCNFSDGLGNLYYIISDGMGSGKRAALESNMTVSLLVKLLKAGTGLDAAIKTVNLMLLAKSGEEIFATADLLCINVFSGRADIIKLGAAQTLIKTGGVVKSIESRTMPLGILSPIQYERRTIHLSDGDCAVMFSDGIREEHFPKVRELMLSDGYSPQRCADAVAEYGKNNESSQADDKTVFVVKLHKF